MGRGKRGVSVREGLGGGEYNSGGTTGFEELKAHALKVEHVPEAVARVTGIAAETIVRLARAYGGAGGNGGGPAGIRLNYGIQRRENGGRGDAGGFTLPRVRGARQATGRGAAAFNA